ncbi:hypothetical protein [Myroides injenensis]|uniref:hypothetical protein n=1 Tax=Myroides injenensis TaxID=1183151 RepID=UPI000288FDE9|nr:hypothetical protein [Myroides injenensis]
MIKRITLVFTLLASIFIFGQTPGGISNITVEYWLKADELLPVLPQDGDEVKRWQDVSGNNRHFILPEKLAYAPEFVKSAINYHSAVDFYFLSNEDDVNAPSLINNRRRKLESISSMPISNDRSYYIIWVSRFDNENSDEKATVLTLNGSTSDQDNFGWLKADNKLFMEIKTTKILSSSNSNDGYSIGIAMVPNQGRNGLLPELIHNGKLNTALKGGELTNKIASQSVIGNSLSGDSPSGAFFGEIAEIIVISRSAGMTGSLLSTEELAKITSYLSLKYGIGVDSSNENQYMLSNGTIIYDGSLSGYSDYNNHIFGIIRDDASGIYQKQSASISKVAMTISLGDIAELNAENQNAMPDKSALLFGGNSATGSTDYAYDVGTVFQNYTFTTSTDPETGVISQDRLSSRENYILRAKTTGQDSFTVTIRPELGEWLLVSNNPSFTPANTKIYKMKSGQIKDVVINDGDYIGFAFNLKAPGGVIDGLKMWLNASASNTVQTNTLGEVETWSDHAGLGTTYRRYAPNNASALYLKADERTNFHPTLEFRKYKDYLVTDKAAMSVASPAHVAIYTVINHNFATDRSYFIGFGAQKTKSDARRPSFGVFREKGGGGFGRIGSTGLTNSKTRLFEPGATTIAGYHWNVGTDITFEFDAHRENRDHKSNKALMNGPGMLGLASSDKNYYLMGVMPEVIMYDRVLTKEERDKINSYLGLKYGITIDLDKYSNLVNFEYLFSDGTRIWEGNDRIHNSYHNNVASVIRDDNANLSNKQSRSTDVGAIVHMGVGSKLGIDPVLDQINNDKSSITWGHNKGSLGLHSFLGNNEVCGEMDSRIDGRIWLVDKENFDQDILVAAHGPNFPFNGPGYQVFLLVADSAEKLIANKWDRIVPMAYDNDMHAVHYKFQDEFTYFTFGAKFVGSCDGCTFEGLKKLDFTKETWKPKGKEAKNINLGDDFSVRITVDDPSNNLRNNYPRASSLKSLREKRKGASDVTTKIEFNTTQGAKAAVSASFELFDIDRTGKIIDIVQVIGYCSGSTVYPKLSYSYNNPSKSRYTIDQIGTAKAKQKGVSYSGNSGYTNRRGRVFVEFENPVEEIHIIYTTKSSTSTYSNSFIGIGAMELYCPKPLPAPNEDGLIFLKQGTSDVLLCEIVDYKFRAVNTNCYPKEIDFTDTLPEGMVWVNNSFTAENTELEESNISGYGTRTLSVSGLMIPGGGSTYTLRASAIFEEDAVAGTYKNRGQIEYDRLGSLYKMESIDRLTGEEYTETVAHNSDRPKQVITSMVTDKVCFSLDKEIEVTLNINNQNNTALPDMLLSFDFDNSAFTFVKNSLQTSKNLNLGNNQGEDGDIEYEDFKLPPGESWVKFRIKASNNINDYDVDSMTGDPISITLAYELFSEGEDECLEGALINANGEIELPYCSICYYPKVVGDNGDITNSNGYMAITSLNRNNDNWISKRGNAFVVLESFNKGLVVTRLSTVEIESLKPVEGMIVYDSTVNCLKVYNGNSWGCIVQGCVDQ